jgi:dynein light chain roadblock-type
MLQRLTVEFQDEMKLLRLRTKKYELVIVPDAKYLLLVVHETPAA